MDNSGSLGDLPANSALKPESTFDEHLENEYIQLPPSHFPHTYLALEEGKKLENIYESIPEADPKWRTLAISIALLLLLATIGAMTAWFFGIFRSNSNKNSSRKVPIGCDFITNSTTFCRQQFIRNMTRTAWNAYRVNAWGHAALKPVTFSYNNWNYGIYTGASIIGTMSTLYVMGLEEEWTAGRKWIETEFNFGSVDQSIPVGHVIRLLFGGLLSAYALSGETVFKDKAVELMNILEGGGFNPITGLAYLFFTPSNGTDKEDQDVNYIELAFNQPEYLYAAKLLAPDNLKLKNRLSKVRYLQVELIENQANYSTFIDLPSGFWMDFATNSKVSITRRSPTFFSNLLRAYLASGRVDGQMLQLYIKATQNWMINDLLEIFKNDLDLDQQNNSTEKKQSLEIGNEFCQTGAMFALGAKELKAINGNSSELAAQHWNLAVNLTLLCQKAVDKTKAKLLPRTFSPSGITINAKGYLDYTLAENYFIFWKLTGDTVYREAAWRLTQAIWQHARTISGGYSGVLDVNQIPTEKDDLQNPIFLSATLKYLYLTFSDDSVLPLDRWIFSPFGHPLPVDKVVGGLK